ncbi:serine/threonine-protein kinase [Okeania sp. SIO1F9]|uniref:serine/threonine protein kinase n=1 Tax=Okeania sp. SIO1F9 TaxID=2607813 RepID=UPI00144BAA01|nr:serine/threonine-protein kinase [Okeania sp. SIO1F9]NET77438.1 protein kinase [Okeania sp. SIO1F9]
MNNYPNFSSHAYQIIRELGHNNIGGRVTYLAENIHTHKNVVIKQFQFAKLGATWAEYDAYSQEIEVLKSLQHPSIPQYLDSFQTTDGFCMIQEYINAESAQTFLMWQPQEIKQIAISILEILVYLQSQAQPVIHRDIKPENILIDEELNVYLVDFGFARMGGGEIAASSVVKGTMGFMSPEQMFNRQLTTASDLYSLGATLICLLTGIKSADIGNLIDANYRIIFRHLVPPLQRGWINWLEKMVEPKPTDRYKNAKKALAVLQPLDVNRLPKARISRKNLAFISNLWGEKLTETITVSNPIPETILSGRWEVAAHVSDPPHTPYDHSWISFSPYKFEGNNVKCEITVDTSKLVKNEVYRREIFLHSNAVSEIETINIQVETRSLPKLEAESIFMFFFTRFVAAVFIFFSFNSLQFNTLFIWWAVISITVCALFNYINKAVKRAIIFGVLSIITVLAFIMIAIGVYIGDFLQLLFPAIIILVISYYLARLYLFILAETIKLIIIPEDEIDRLFSETEQILIFPLAIGLEFSLVISFKIFFEVIPQLHCFTLGEILVSAIVAFASLTATLIPLIYLISKPLKIISKYRKSEPSLIKP